MSDKTMLRALVVCVALFGLACDTGEADEGIQEWEQAVALLDPHLPISPGDPPPSYTTPRFCGNGRCELGESRYTCPVDCGPLTGETKCGDGICSPGESCGSCSHDCGPCCGNGICGSGENFGNCSLDCKTCGSGKCDLGEHYGNCPTDCPTCGNGVVDQGEQCEGTGFTTLKTCEQMSNYLYPYCGGYRVQCKGCKLDMSLCYMWVVAPQLNACVACDGYCKTDENEWGCKLDGDSTCHPFGLDLW